MGSYEYIKATVRYIRYWILFIYFYLKFYYLNIYDKLFSLERRCIEIFHLKIFNYDMTIFNPKNIDLLEVYVSIFI